MCRVYTTCEHYKSTMWTV